MRVGGMRLGRLLASRFYPVEIWAGTGACSYVDGWIFYRFLCIGDMI